jgi:protein TonB
MTGGESTVSGQEPLFSHLIASKPPKEAGAAAAATTASLIFHGAVVAGAVVATLAVGSEVAKEKETVEEVTFVKIEEQPPPPPPPPPEQAPPPPEVVKPRGFQTLAAPEVVPIEIPPPDSVATNEADFSGEGVEGGVAEGVETAGVDTTQTYLQGQVSVIPKMIKVVKPRYPDFLKKMEIEGTVIIQAIIRTNGEVDASSVRVIKKLHPQLDQAAVEALVASEFSPALYGSRPVRVIMQIPYTFKFR